MLQLAFTLPISSATSKKKFFCYEENKNFKIQKKFNLIFYIEKYKTKYSYFKYF
jgi:hypothetical protein